MKIKQARIFNYGKWHQATIPFSTGLNILYGKNEAGKTTLISFIKGVLFGYLQRRTSHKNYIPRASKNYGGQLDIISKGQEYTVQRMAGKNGGALTVLDPDGNQVDNSVLLKILGPFNRDTFDALYYFGTVDLQKMGKLKQKDLIYRIQRIGLSHSDEWIDYREALVKRSKHLYSPRGYKPPLNQALKQYDQLIDQAKSAKASYSDYQKLLNTIERLKSQRVSLNKKLKRLNQRTAQLARDQDAWLRYQKMIKLKPLMAKPIQQGFSNQDVKHLRDLQDRLEHVKNQIELVKQQLSESDHQKVMDDAVTNYQNHQGTIDKLANQFNDVQRQIHQRSLQESRDRDVSSQLRHLRAQYTVNGTLLKPLSLDDLRKVKRLNNQALTNHKNNQVLSHQLMALQAHRQLGGKEYLIGGVGLLAIIAGVIIKWWLLAGLGAVILILGTVLSLNHRQQKRVQKNQKDVKELQLDDKHIQARLLTLQKKYHYQNLNVEDWVANQNNLRRAQTLSAKVTSLDQNLRQADQQIHRYFAQWSFINRDLTLSSDVASKLLQLRNYVSKMTRIIKVNRQADQEGHAKKQRLTTLTQQRNDTQNHISKFYRTRRVRDVKDFETVKDQQTRLIQQQDTYQKLSKQIGKTEINVLKRYQSLDDLKAKYNAINHQIMALRAQIQRLTSQLTSSQVKLRQMVQNGSYDELQQRIANYRTQINELAERWLEESLASQWINATLNLATKGRVPKIEKQAQINFQILTNDRYSSIIFNKSKIKVLRHDKQRFTLYELSKGTVQQLYLALVFAMAQVFSSDYPMPVLIDDGFTDFDVNRKQAAISLLKSISQKLQVIYCTSDHELVDQPETVNLDQIKPKD